MMKIGDLVLIMICAALAGSAYWFAWRPAGAARVAELRTPGEPVRRVALDSPREMTVAGIRGDSRIEIRAGAVRFVDSPCSGKQCIHSGWLDHAGDFAACLPNGVTLTLAGGAKGYDAVGY